MRATFTSFSAFDHLHDDRFDALVLNGGADASAALSLISALRRNARLYDIQPKRALLDIKGDRFAMMKA